MRTRRRPGQGAFTLIELMIVLVILGVLAVAIVPNVVGKSQRAKRTKAITDIAAMELLLDEFHLDMGRYPTTEEGLRVLYYPPEDDREKWKGPYSKKPIGRDPWGHPDLYRCPGTRPLEPYEIVSYGKDGQEGGEGDNADMGSWVDVEEEE
jgi:general secretion pathway protein G